LTEAQEVERATRATGANAPWWKGGRFVNDKGYVLVIAPPDYPFPESVAQVGRIREHRMVMELHLGRALTRSEVVHHINGDRADNRIENLEVHTSHSEHMREHAEDGADRMRKATAATRSIPATCSKCGGAYRTNARSTGVCAPCRAPAYEANRPPRRSKAAVEA
jgi:hypothetical protein